MRAQFKYSLNFSYITFMLKMSIPKFLSESSVRNFDSLLFTATPNLFLKQSPTINYVESCNKHSVVPECTHFLFYLKAIF